MFQIPWRFLFQDHFRQSDNTLFRYAPMFVGIGYCDHDIAPTVTFFPSIGNGSALGYSTRTW
ncbi:MAG TPA: hypothetical protein PLC94_08785, partial [bacterium]|nr:hypothetical protein [bacterium]